MALIKAQISYPICNHAFLENRSLRMTHLYVSRKVEDMAFKPQCLNIPNGRAKLDSLLNIGYGNKRKMINHATLSTTQSTTVDSLDACEDDYDGVIINPQCLPTSANAFAAILRSSLSYWKLKGKEGIWLKILEEQAELVPIALKEGFRYHHADPGYVMLTYWIPEEPCMLPSTATHQIGVGGFVINDNREVLVVKEKKCPLRCSGIWKLPTGFINKSEEIFSGAVREVKEETGIHGHLLVYMIYSVSLQIDTTFLEVLAFRYHESYFLLVPCTYISIVVYIYIYIYIYIYVVPFLLLNSNPIWFDISFHSAIHRHAHQVTFEKSDLFFICMLKPLTSEITIDEREIAAAKWMPLDEFLAQPYHQGDRMSKNVVDICVSSYENKYRGFTALQMMSKLDDRLSYLYCGDLLQRKILVHEYVPLNFDLQNIQKLLDEVPNHPNSAGSSPSLPIGKQVDSQSSTLSCSLLSRLQGCGDSFDCFAERDREFGHLEEDTGALSSQDR
ncbi:hypothetical protein C4D60_Mb10t09250 [Musa balbisiana]|uniref:Nudix hydrolase domain-containing protein n=1 Tax=Musa balbisiana TaxID=52838 RepID=A0A4V4H4P3_MUSBA|nr:hypothetical protein C4D60_Mb10t09250 [Musa balbisiana]